MGNYDIFISLLSRKLNPNYPSYSEGGFQKALMSRLSSPSPGLQGGASLPT